MPITAKLLAHADSSDCQILRTDNRKKFIVNSAPEWQFIFGPNSAFSSSQHIVKIAAEFDVNDFNSVRFAAYLYNPVTGGIDSAATCQFKVYQVVLPVWSETLLATFNGTFEYNSYFFADVNLSSLVPADLDGGVTLMIEAVITRLSETFRDRVYVNHLGIYDNVFRLRQDVDFLDITKLEE